MSKKKLVSTVTGYPELGAFVSLHGVWKYGVLYNSFCSRKVKREYTKYMKFMNANKNKKIKRKLILEVI